MCSTVECTSSESCFPGERVRTRPSRLGLDRDLVGRKRRRVDRLVEHEAGASPSAFISRSNAISFGCVPSPVHELTCVAFEVGMGTAAAVAARRAVAHGGREHRDVRARGPHREVAHDLDLVEVAVAAAAGRQRERERVAVARRGRRVHRV